MGRPLVLALFGILTLVTAPVEPRRDDEENRMTAGVSECGTDSILDGSFMTGVEAARSSAEPAW